MMLPPSRLSLVWLVALSGLLSLSITGCQNTYSEGRRAAEDPPGPSDPPASSAAVQRGQKLFQTVGCMGCHMVNGKGGTAGPDLSNEGNAGHSVDWLKTQMRDPKTHDPQTIMPAFGKLSDQQADDLAAYLETLKTGSAQAGPAAPPATPEAPAAGVTRASLVTTGGTLWGKTCGQCHNLRPPSEYSDAQWAVAVHHMRVRVPLTGQEQRDILAFLQASN
jgi:mono/diheme cytochrome c family protein